MACSDYQGAPSAIGGDPIHPMLVAFSIVLLVGALATDIAFWRNGDHFWVLASVCVSAAGVIMGALAAGAGLIEFLTVISGRSSVAGWGSFSGKRDGHTDRVLESRPSAWWQS